MPAPNKPSVKKSSEKGKKPTPAFKSTKKGGSKVQIIIAVVAAVLLIGVGITLYFVFSGDSNKSVAQSPRTNPGAGAGQTPSEAAPGDSPQPAADLSTSLTKAGELTDKLADAASKEDAVRQLRDLLDSDGVTKVSGGRSQVLAVLKDKALGGNEAAKSFIREAAADKNNQILSAAAQKVYDENLRKEGEESVADSGSDALMEPTNFLPNKTDVVFRTQMHKFLNSDYHKAIFATGAFQKTDFDKRMGIDADTVDQIVIGGIKDHGQTIGVIRTRSPFKWDEVKRTLEIEGNGTNIKGKTYYLGKIDFMTEFLGNRIPGIDSLRTKAAFWRPDARTLVYGDEQTIKSLLENPPEKQTPLPPPTASLPGGEVPPSGAGEAPAGGANDAAVAPPGEQPPGGGSLSLAKKGLVPASAGGTAAPQVGQLGGAASTQETPTKPDTTRFLTLDPKFRRLIAHVEDPKHDSLVLFADMATTKVPVLTDYMFYLNRLPSTRGKEVEMIVMLLPTPAKHPVMRLGMACKNRRETPGVSIEVEKILARIAKDELHDLFGFEFNVGGNADASTAQLAQAPGFPGAGGTMGLTGSPPPGPPMGGKMGLGGGAPGLAGGGRPPTLTVGSMGGGGAPGVAGDGIGTPPRASSPPPNVGQPTETEPEVIGGRLSIERVEEYILITATVTSPMNEFTEKHVGNWMAQLRGYQELASKRFRFGDLAASLDQFKSNLSRQNKRVVFPYGAYPRAFDAERGSRPWPANERLSFFRELLPYLGDDRYFSLADKFDVEKSWKDPANVEYGRILVPHFLNPAAGNNYVKVRDVDQPLAATHFVGMAGVGPEAAYYPKSDPRAGIFGYNRQATVEEVKDGLSNTIFLIEVDKAMVGPWIAGGGATVRGTSNAGNDVGRRGGFTSPNVAGKAGVWVMMADGSARFLTKDVNPEVFKALCTMAGGDSPGAIDLVAPRQNLDVSSRTGAQQQTAAATETKKRVTEEEEVPGKKK